MDHFHNSRQILRKAIFIIVVFESLGLNCNFTDVYNSWLTPSFQLYPMEEIPANLDVFTGLKMNSNEFSYALVSSIFKIHRSSTSRLVFMSTPRTRVGGCWFCRRRVKESRSIKSCVRSLSKASLLVLNKNYLVLDICLVYCLFPSPS